MNAARHHARLHGNNKAPVCSPWDIMLDDGNANTFIDNRQAPPAGSGLAPASSEIHNIVSIQNAGYPVVTYTVDDTARMTQLLTLKINGIISDRSDLLYAAIAAYDANGDGTPGDYLDADGLCLIRRTQRRKHFRVPIRPARADKALGIELASRPLAKFLELMNVAC